MTNKLMQTFREKRERGFTLIELLIAMAISLVVLTSLSSAFISQRKTYDVQENITAMVQEARAALDMISREAKMAGYDPTGVGIVGIPISETDQLRIVADLNGDGDTLDSHEIITYKEDGENKQIDRATGSSGTDQPFAENIQSFTFEYLESDGTTEVTDAADVANIRQIEITITARTADEDPNYTHPNPTYGDGYRRYTLTSRITPPNLDL